MDMVYRHVSLLLVIAMCGLRGAYTSATDGAGTSYGRLDKLQIMKGRLTRTSCQWDQGDESVMCESLHLRRVPSNFPHNARKLNLANNEISILLNNSFESYPNLVTLYLMHNKLKTVQLAAFQALKRLESLDLSGNYQLTIPSSVPFRPLKALLYLDINACNLKELPSDFFYNFPNLKHIHLQGNRLSSLNVSRCATEQLNEVHLNHNNFRDLTPDTFMFVCRTKFIGLIQNPIHHISEDAIAALPVDKLLFGMPLNLTSSLFLNLMNGVAKSAVTTLILRFVELPDGIPVGVFTSLYDSPLDMLVIGSSGDLSLYENVFLGLSNCQDLTLIDNFINTVRPEYFLGMSGLLSLSLIDNQIINFNPHNTTWKSNMEYMGLSQNKLVQLHSYQFRGLSNLKCLNLSHMRLVWLDFVSYDGLEGLDELDVSGTEISILGLSPGLSKLYFPDLPLQKFSPFKPGETFNNTIKLDLIDISHTELGRENLWDSYSSRSLFQGLINLLELYLSNNPLGNLPDMVFKDNSMLAYLMLDSCKISSLTGNVFQGLDSLVHLNLNGNNLLLISTDALRYLSVLETLSINDNAIMFVEERAMEHVPLLKNLRMSNNRLVAFNRSTWNTLRKYDLDYIDISGNPFDCQCYYDWLYNLVNSSKILLNQNGTLCSVNSLNQFRGKPLLVFDPSQYCVPNIVLISTLPFVGLALLIGLLLAFHNRWLIRYKLFLVKLAVIGYRELLDAREHNDFIYDLNIMFTEDDELWAREHLRPTLEEHLPDYDRYSFGDDDLTLGMHYLEAVHYAVENSFKTIMLLSRSAVRDNWFLIKLRTAMDHVNDGLTENTVVIFLEDIPEDEIPYLLRLYLSDRRPYMRWPEDVRGQQYFWNKLRKTVTVNLKYNPLIPPE